MKQLLEVHLRCKVHENPGTPEAKGCRHCLWVETYLGRAAELSRRRRELVAELKTELQRGEILIVDVR